VETLARPVRGVGEHSPGALGEHTAEVAAAGQGFVASSLSREEGWVVTQPDVPVAPGGSCQPLAPGTTQSWLSKRSPCRVTWTLPVRDDTK
jgi:hypothetical protein